MAGISYLKSIKKVFGLGAVMLVFCASLVGQAQAADVVTTKKTEDGWTLQVNGEDFYVKGVVW